eukprot:Em0003g329a
MSAIEGEYIVVLKDTLTSQEVSDHIAWARQQVAQSGHGSTIMDVFSMGTFNGYSAKLAPHLLAQLERSSAIAYVEKNQEVSIND